MSGYFARLSAQVHPMAYSTRRAVAPAPLERHVEVDAAAQPVGERMADDRAPLGAAVPSPAAMAQPRLAAADGLASPAAVHPAQAQTPAAPSTRKGSANEAAARPRDPALSETSRAALSPMALERPTRSQPRHEHIPEAGAPLDIGTAHTQSRNEPAFTPSAGHPAQAPQRPSRQAASARPSMQPRAAESQRPAALEVDEAQPSAFIRPSARLEANDQLHMRAPQAPFTPSALSAQLERPTVRIGTITLEVHPPSVTAPSAPQPVAAAPTPAPSQFSLRRHHLRWS